MRKFFEYLKNVSEELWPYLPYIFITVADLVRDAEETFKGAGQGKIKKEYVMNLAGVLIAGMQFFTEHEEYRSMVLKVVSKWIDVVVYSFNSFGGWGRKARLDFPSGTEV